MKSFQQTHFFSFFQPGLTLLIDLNIILSLVLNLSFRDYARLVWLVGKGTARCSVSVADPASTIGLFTKFNGRILVSIRCSLCVSFTTSLLVNLIEDYDHRSFSQLQVSHPITSFFLQLFTAISFHPRTFGTTLRMFTAFHCLCIFRIWLPFSCHSCPL